MRQAEGPAQAEAREWELEGRAGTRLQGAQEAGQGCGLCCKCDGKSWEGSSAGNGKISFIKLDMLLAPADGE